VKCILKIIFTLAIFILFERCDGKGPPILMKLGLVIPFTKQRNTCLNFLNFSKLPTLQGLKVGHFGKRCFHLIANISGSSEYFLENPKPKFFYQDGQYSNL